MTADGERIASLEVRYAELDDDIEALGKELGRCRDRLHKVEGFQAVLAEDKKRRDALVAQRQKRIEFRLSTLAVVVAIATVLSPILYHYLGFAS